MDAEPKRGTRRQSDGRWRVFYDGYWVREYPAPADTLLAKKTLIDALTRRLFNHVEHGINVPGTRLAEVRRAYEAEADPERRRVKGAMLAGALFNRATGIITKLVELQSLGVDVGPDNPLMRECGLCLREALELGKLVRHRSGEEGIDELWGEPFKAFAFPIQDFYESRYAKIAMALGAIDSIGAALLGALGDANPYVGVADRITDFVAAAKAKCETLRTDEEVFEVWTSFSVAGDRLESFRPGFGSVLSPEAQCWLDEGRRLLKEARNVITYITRARTPMPKTTGALLERCAALQSSRERALRGPERPLSALGAPPTGAIESRKLSDEPSFIG